MSKRMVKENSRPNRRVGVKTIVGCVAVFITVIFLFSGSGGRRSEIREDFESGKFKSTLFSPGSSWTHGWMVSSPDRVVSGKCSSYGRAESKSEWWEFLYSDSKKLRLERNRSYTVTFSYKAVEAPSTDGFYYFVVRSSVGGIANDKAFTKWSDTEGSVGTQQIDFTLGDFNDYYLIWGIYRQGALSIDDIDITEHKGNSVRIKIKRSNEIK